MTHLYLNSVEYSLSKLESVFMINVKFPEISRFRPGKL